MSYDIAIIDHHKRFETCKEFLLWYNDAVQYLQEDYQQTSPVLQQWFLKIKNHIRPLNGEFAPAAEELDTGEFLEADYSFGKEMIYVSLASTDAHKTSALARDLAKEFGLAYFDISGMSELYNADGSHFLVSSQQETIDASQEGYNSKSKNRKIFIFFVLLLYLIALYICFLNADSWGGKVLILLTLSILIPFYGFMQGKEKNTET